MTIEVFCEDGSILEGKLSFDGENCTYEGPSAFKTEPVTLLFFNESEDRTMAGIFSHTGGETVQDMIDFLGEEPSERRRPSWARLIYVKSAPAGESYIWEGFLEANVYTLLSSCNDPH